MYISHTDMLLYVAYYLIIKFISIQIMDKELKAISKYFSFLLRHQPEAIGLQLNDQGWAPIDDLIKKTTDFKLTRELIEIIVETNDKQRFSISEDGDLIKANQGHSIEVNLNLTAQEPPEILLHGTSERFIKLIESIGLTKQKRHHVHLTESEAVAKTVGGRYGKPIILAIPAKKMHQDGYTFFKTVNNVWLADHIPIVYIRKYD